MDADLARSLDRIGYPTVGLAPVVRFDGGWLVKRRSRTELAVVIGDDGGYAYFDSRAVTDLRAATEYLCRSGPGAGGRLIHAGGGTAGTRPTERPRAGRVRQAGPVRNPMFVPDDHLATMIFDYCRWRLALDPVPLDFPGDKATLERALAGVISRHATRSGRRPRALRRCTGARRDLLRQPPFSGLHPGRPDQSVTAVRHGGLVLFDAGDVVAGGGRAVSAENQALRVLADLAGLPAGAGGCFVSGGSAGNLSALVVAREAAGVRLGATGRRRGCGWP